MIDAGRGTVAHTRLRLAAKRIVDEHRLFLILLAIATILRLLTIVLYHPSVLQWVDALRYLRVSPHAFFGDPFSPAGYPAFVRAIHFFDSNLVVTVAIQHLVGLIGATFVYLMVRRVSKVSWLGVVPAGIVLFSGDYIFLEHILMSDTLFMTLVFISLYAALRALDDAHPKRWLAISGLVMMGSALVRPITLEIPLVIGVWAFLVLGGALWHRTVNGLAVIAPAAALLAAYLAVAAAIGPHTGINEMTGWDLYSRVAPFANCDDFTPPPGTAKLCESTPPGERPGPYYYGWIKTSPGLSNFPLTPAGGKKPGEFARAAIKGQPLAYLKAVVKDMVRYVDPNVGLVRSYSGIPYALYQFDYKTPGEEERIGALIERKGYTDVLPVHADAINELEAYQAVFHLGGLPILIMAVLALIGMVLERGRRRAAISLLTVCSFLMFLLPVLTLSYEVRYGWPPTPLLAAAATLAALGLFERVRHRNTAIPAAVDSHLGDR